MTDVTVEAVNAAETPVAAPATAPEKTEIPADWKAAAADVFGTDKPETPVEGETPAETPVEAAEPEEPKKEVLKVDEKVAAKIAANRKAEARAHRERAKLQEEIATLNALKAEEASVRKRLEILKGPNKIARLREIGENPLEFVKEIAQDPAVIDPTTVELQNLKAEILAEREARKQMEAALQEREVQVRTHAIQQDVSEAQRIFIGEVASMSDKLPNIVKEFTPREIAQRGLEIAKQYSAEYERVHNQPLTNDVIAEQLELEAIQRAEERNRGWNVKAVPASQATAVNAGIPVRNETPRTLTTGATSTSAPTQRWTQEWADQESIRMLDEALRRRNA